MHVVVNAAMSADGKLSTREREQIAISGPDDSPFLPGGQHQRWPLAS